MVKWMGCEDDHSSITSVEVKDECSYHLLWFSAPNDILSELFLPFLMLQSGHMDTVCASNV